MTEEQIATLLRELDGDGIWVRLSTDGLHVQISHSRLVISVPSGLHYLIHRHEQDMIAYLAIHMPPQPAPNYHRIRAQGLLETWEAAGHRLILVHEHLALQTDDYVGWYPGFAVQALEPEFRQLLEERGTPLGKRRKISAELRTAIIRFHDYTCQYCQREGNEYDDPDGRPWHIDHVQPVAFGGSNDPANLILACEHCNLSKGSKGVEKFMEQ